MTPVRSMLYQHFQERHLHIAEELFEVVFPQLGLEHLLQAERQVGVLSGVVRGRLDIDLVEPDLFLAGAR